MCFLALAQTEPRMTSSIKSRVVLGVCVWCVVWEGGGREEPDGLARGGLGDGEWDWEGEGDGEDPMFRGEQTLTTRHRHTTHMNLDRCWPAVRRHRIRLLGRGLAGPLPGERGHGA